MPFILKEYKAIKGYIIQHYLVNELNFSVRDSQSLIHKKRVFDKDLNPYQIGQKIKDDIIKISVFEGISKGLKPLFYNKDFAIFDKPSGIMVHPSSRYTKYSLLDEIRYHFGQNANLAHRIDTETSGLVLVAVNKISDIYLKMMFEDKKYKKSYLAYVKGKIDKSLTINEPIKRSEESIIGVKMVAGEGGKSATTIINPIKYINKLDISLVEAIPVTGRTHQIRVHLDFIGHTIIGDPIYSVEEKIVDLYLSKKLNEADRAKFIGYPRLMLQAQKLEFVYNDVKYAFVSKQKFDIIKEKLYKA